MREVQLITSIMRGEIINKSELDIHLRGEDNLH